MMTDDEVKTLARQMIGTLNRCLAYVNIYTTPNEKKKIASEIIISATLLKPTLDEFIEKEGKKNGQN